MSLRVVVADLLIVAICSTLISEILARVKFPDESEQSRIISGLKWLGLFSSEPAIIRGNNLLDTLTLDLPFIGTDDCLEEVLRDFLLPRIHRLGCVWF